MVLLNEGEYHERKNKKHFKNNRNLVYSQYVGQALPDNKYTVRIENM